jgi:hypothetical protein
MFLLPQILLFVDIYNECFAVQQLYITVKDNTCCKNKERFITKGTEACHSSFDISSHHHLLVLERTASRNGDLAFAIGQKHP